MIDIIGKKFNRLTVLERRGTNKNSGVLYLCQCECGNQKVIAGRNVRKGFAKSCGCLLVETRREQGKKSASDLTGKRFGRLTVLERAGSNKHNNALWLCECECGNQKIIVGYRISNGATRSCGCLLTEARRNAGKKSVKNLLGMRFGRLTVVKREGTNGSGNAIWDCLCDCGEKVDVVAGHLQKGATKSCGCIRKERPVIILSKLNTTHGLTHTKEYKRHRDSLRRTRELEACPKWADKKKILEIYKNCPDGHHVDHIIPLINKNVCGLHVESNLQYLTVKANLRKSNKFNF